MTILSTPTTLTQADIFAGYTNPEWCGFGYLGTRNHALDTTVPDAPAQPDRVAQADERALAEANRRGWSAREFFEWMNSTRGRYFGDVWFGSDDPDDWESFTPGLMVLPEDL